MFVISIIAGILSSMNIWVNKTSDISLSLNDLYMALLMTGWMFLFTGVLDKNNFITLFGILLTAGSFYAIRTQLFINQKQYLLGMIPHHSMAILMSKELQKKENNIPKLLNDIITNQENEIKFIKEKLLS
jgi:hypothetical protein